jgi:hypothetical protein
MLLDHLETFCLIVYVLAEQLELSSRNDEFGLQVNHLTLDWIYLE